MSVQAETMEVGMSSATSSAWVGPDSATSFTWSCCPSLLNSSRMTSVMVMSVSGSMPLATSTIICPSGMNGRALSAVCRMAIDGTAKSRISLPLATVCKSQVKCTVSGMTSPGSAECVRVADRFSISFGNFDHTVTSCPLRCSSRASAMPHVPEPRMPIVVWLFMRCFSFYWMMDV